MINLPASCDDVPGLRRGERPGLRTAMPREWIGYVEQKTRRAQRVYEANLGGHCCWERHVWYYTLYRGAKVLKSC